MKAIKRISENNQAHLQLCENIDIPELKAGQLLVKVGTAAINRTDLIAKKTGNLPQGNSILGVEVSGIVVESDSDNFQVGTRVMGLVNGGGYAEFAVMNAGNAMLLPDSLDFEEGAAIPEVFLTAYQTLFWLGQLKNNEKVLIHAGASGVGTAAIQLVKQLTSAKIFVTAGSAEKLALCQKLGADVLINYHEEDFDRRIEKTTAGEGVDVILDFVGASYWKQNLNSLAYDGRMILIGILGGSMVNEVNLMQLLEKRVTITGTLLTPRSDVYKSKLTKEFIEKTSQLFTSGHLKPIVDSTFSLDEVDAAHEYMESNKNKGKIILTVNKI